MEPQPGVIGSPTSPQGQGPLKFSRYRSVRQAAAKKQQEASKTLGLQVNQSYLTSTAITDDPRSESAQKKPHNETIAQSMSRYRRARLPAVTHPPPPEPQPPLPQLVDRSRVDASNADRCEIGTPRNVSNPYTRIGGQLDSSQESESGDDEEDDAIRERNRREAMERLTSEERQMTPEKVRTTREHRERRDHDRHREMKEPGFITEHATRRDVSDSTASPRMSWKARITRSKSRGRSQREASETKQTATDDGSSGKNIEPVGGGIVPGFDAPVSAVNAGERKVTVKCNESGIVVPVTPTTCSQDIITFACNVLSEPIDPQRSILLESFHQLGLERPLRRYEHIRDVLNSWDSDTQNSLVIIPASSSSAIDELDVKAVPEQQPEEQTFHIYHSQRPGKWDKRYVTLRADGQVVMAKKLGHEQTNVCHLSDFDIYSPTPRQLAKKIKAPKKICFAVKSQQKSSMFLSTENFVHFFATNHRDIATQWHKAVQGWRSWYLVNVLGQAQKDQGLTQTTHHTRYQQHMHQKNNQSHAPASFPKKLSLDTQHLDSRHLKDVPPRSDSSQNVEDATFSPTGLLGRTYSQRQRLMRERERERERKEAEEGPFSPHGLLNALSPTVSPPCSHPFSNPSSRVNSRTNTMRSTHDPDTGNSDLNRSTSTRQKPLVDLTPVYREPPQHARKGHGVTVAPGVPLVDAATGPELAPGAIVVPSATTWRRPAQHGVPALPDEPADMSNTGAGIPKRSNTTRSRKHGSGHEHGTNGASSTLVDYSITSPDSQFAPNSLLARADKLATAQGGVGTGHGVASGDRNATKPLLDLTPQSQFAEGSLLGKLESS
ncbi:hypothetical protein DTO027B5_852 [Paecilomyces variotii]|nr:hypothetical protein DTO169C6_361 [Paecilomyces variotii]KAJ9329677.1 hypothetical protein DTO027B3_164 [Paecilomyces variotii]KAJ9337503.1 hypothetical protein DTO027B5_852 [Paecilomyces variotii]